MRPFPRLVLNWDWKWNTNAKSVGRKGPSNETLRQLREFYSPYNDALAELLRHRRQVQAAEGVDQWKVAPQ